MNTIPLPMEDTNELHVRNAFSRQSPLFDMLDDQPLIQWVRDRVRARTMETARPGDRMLEINAGTGIDSLWFAQHGLDVLATDDAPGMVDLLERKRDAHPSLKLRVARCSFLRTEDLGEGGFDLVFSNFGGINCTQDLQRVMEGIRARLRIGGVCVLVIMPRFSPWELIDALRGNVRHAFRRYRSGGAPARIEGVRFQCHYHDVSSVLKVAQGFTLLDRSALSFFVPPPHLAPFAARHPRLLRSLQWLEERCCRWPFIRSRGDHYLLVLQRVA